MKSFEEAENFINSIPRFAAKSGPENVRRMLNRLGDPETSCQTIHIAGTNGKGSVARMISLFLEEEGERTGLFISPHLIRINERMSVNGTEISNAEFLDVFQIVKKASDENVREGYAHPSYFEFLFLMAAVYFRQKKCTCAVYETGLGGRLDATSSLSPVLTAITAIGMDHTQYLGNTIEEIAGEKAGILKRNVPVVIHTGNPVADRVIRNRAAETGIQVFDAGRLQVTLEKPEREGELAFSLRGEEDLPFFWQHLRLHTDALYQTDNAATAAVMARILAAHASWQEEEAAFRRALDRFFWPGRMQRIGRNIILDGAHNENAARKLVSSLKFLQSQERWNRRELLFAVSSDKDYKEVTEILSRELSPSRIYVTELNTDRRTDHRVLDQLFREENQPDTEILNFPDPAEALEAAMGHLQPDTLLVITGSLYLAGEILEKQHD